MNTAVRKRFFTRFVAAALLVTGATGAGTLAPSALAAPSEAKVQESVVFTKAGQIMYTVSIADYTQTLTTQSCTDTLESAMPKTEAKINPVFKENEGYNYCSGTATYGAQAGHEFYSLNGDKLTGHNRVDALLTALKPLKVSSINSNVSVHDATVTSASDGVKVNQSGGEGKGYFMQWRNSTHQNTFTATVRREVLVALTVLARKAQLPTALSPLPAPLAQPPRREPVAQPPVLPVPPALPRLLTTARL